MRQGFQPKLSPIRVGIFQSKKKVDLRDKGLILYFSTPLLLYFHEPRSLIPAHIFSDGIVGPVVKNASAVFAVSELLFAFHFHVSRFHDSHVAALTNLIDEADDGLSCLALK